MPAKETLHVALVEPLVRHVRNKVVAGHHPVASDVVRASLHRSMKREELRQLQADLGGRADADG